jgi:fructose/tagatose bisphosphate aldolase
MLLNATQTRALFQHALEHHYAVLAINADSPACITDALEAARQSAAPVIVETSLWQLNGHSFGAGDAALGMARYLAQLEVLAASPKFASVPVVFHTDHIKGAGSLELLQTAIRGFDLRGVKLRPSSLSLDASELSHADNIAAICKLCETAQEIGVSVTLEMEAGVDDGVTPLEDARTLLEGVEAQYPGRISLWAPGVGTRHGLGSQAAFSADAVRAHQSLASSLTGRPVGIALHGSSGLSEDGLRAAVAAGVAKVNWSSESLLLRSGAALEYYRTHTAQLGKTHQDWKATAMDNGVQTFTAERYVSVVVERMHLLGGSGQGPAFLSGLRADRLERTE